MLMAAAVAGMRRWGLGSQDRDEFIFFNCWLRTTPCLSCPTLRVENSFDPLALNTTQDSYQYRQYFLDLISPSLHKIQNLLA